MIDRRVRSDDTVTHKATIFLLAGRPYGLKLDLFSYPKPPAKIRLLWRPPGGQLQVVPNSALIPDTPSEAIVVSTAFPADDASHGYERGIAVSRQWDAATTEATIDTANWVAQRMWKLAKTNPTSEESEKKLRGFCHRFVASALVKELTDQERSFFVDQHFDQDLSLENQVKRVVIMTLKSPRFLYPELQQRAQGNQLARRMGLCLWDSMPDAHLTTLAKQEKLSDPVVLADELARMVRNPRSKQKLRSFFQNWTESGRAAEMTKDGKLYPGFDAHLTADLRTSLGLYLDDVLWSEESDFRQLFLADYLFVNDRLAKFYGLECPGSGFKKVQLDSGKSAGILTHPYLMSHLAYHKNSSPIHRGVFVAKNILGRRLRQPPNNVKPLAEEFDPPNVHSPTSGTPDEGHGLHELPLGHQSAGIQFGKL